jgi:Gas vesicle synthesis protein GvpL/GvpF
VPADVQPADDVRGVGDPPGRIERVRHGGLAALVSEVDLVKGRYVGQTVLAEALTEIPEAARMGEQIRGQDPDATRQARIRLGEIIIKAIIAKRAADARALGEVLAPHRVASVVREPTHELDAVQLALLVEITRQDDMEQALSGLAADWEGRIELRLLGPRAPYDFAPALVPPRG